MRGVLTKTKLNEYMVMDIDMFLKGLGFSKVEGEQYRYTIRKDEKRECDIVLKRLEGNIILFDIYIRNIEKDTITTESTVSIYMLLRILSLYIFSEEFIVRYEESEIPSTPPYIVVNEMLFLDVGKGYQLVEVGTDVVAYKGGHIEGIDIENETLDVFQETHGSCENSDIYIVPFFDIKRIYSKVCLEDIIKEHKERRKKKHNDEDDNPYTPF